MCIIMHINVQVNACRRFFGLGWGGRVASLRGVERGAAVGGGSLSAPQAACVMTLRTLDCSACRLWSGVWPDVSMVMSALE